MDYVNIQAKEGITEDEIENLRMLYQTPIGTIPMERDKGIDTSSLSMPTEASKSLLSVEIIKKTRQYSNLEVSELEITSDDNGKLTAKVVVTHGE